MGSKEPPRSLKFADHAAYIEAGGPKKAKTIDPWVAEFIKLNSEPSSGNLARRIQLAQSITNKESAGDITILARQFIEPEMVSDLRRLARLENDRGCNDRGHKLAVVSFDARPSDRTRLYADEIEDRPAAKPRVDLKPREYDPATTMKPAYSSNPIATAPASPRQNIRLRLGLNLEPLGFNDVDTDNLVNMEELCNSLAWSFGQLSDATVEKFLNELYTHLEPGQKKLISDVLYNKERVSRLDILDQSIDSKTGLAPFIANFYAELGRPNQNRKGALTKILTKAAELLDEAIEINNRDRSLEGFAITLAKTFHALRDSDAGAEIIDKLKGGRPNLMAFENALLDFYDNGAPYNEPGPWDELRFHTTEAVFQASSYFFDTLTKETQANENRQEPAA